jgi:cytochrome c biogenesis protein CcmG/thiol:disulfide interchange protein DsbE
MRRLLLPGLVAGLAVALLALLVDQAIARGERPAAPDRALPLLDGGGMARLADHRGKWVVVNFFASWCDPCEVEAPVLDRVQQRLGDEGTVLGVAWNDATADTREFVRDFGVSFPVVRDVGEELSEDYEVRGLPESFVIDPRGRLVAIARGPIDERWMRETLEPLLGGGTGAG